MANLYVTSAETFSGKSALCVGLGLRMREDGLKVGYMKPVNVNCQLLGGMAYDEDVEFAKKVFEMPESADVLSPVALTPARLEQQLRGPETNYVPRLKDAFAKVSSGRDVVILEGGRSLREGYVVNLQPMDVVEMLNAQALAVLRYDADLMVDRALTAQWYFKPNFLGVAINSVPRAHVEHVNEVVVPYLMRHGMNVFGVLPKEQLLSAPTVAELAQGLKAEILCCAEATDELVEHMLIGAMSVEGALAYFRRKPNKAVITGGDRADIQLAALETSTRCLILTGNLYPSPVVLNRAEELGVPVLLVDLDTLSTIEIIEGYFGRSRFQQPQKISRFTAMLNQHFNYDLLYEKLQIKREK